MVFQAKIRKLIKLTKRRLFELIAKLTGKKESSGEFSSRIRARRKAFWYSPDSEDVIYTPMVEFDSFEKWKDGKNWQRKLHNKNSSREFARKHHCRVPDLYWKGNNINALNFENLPNHYVIRPTIGYSSNGVFLMNNSVNLMDGKTYSTEDIKKALAMALDENKKVEFLVEEFLRTESGEYKIPVDYKFFMFNGEVACIWVINRLGPKKGFATFYNENWEMIENINTLYPKGDYQEAPECFHEMLGKAKELSKAYEIFVRIDFYATDKGAYFGEFTPTPARGKHFTPGGDKLLANYWDQFCKGMI